ncbi:hypothetical protein ACFW53_20585 [Nocardiopsis dassonvillei]|uniref:hypothetical protein n=1 Tax=Nocardiopsis dassonvillei TaxID=2014 RepID=UPI003670533D
MLIYAALLSGHWLGDHWAQTDHQVAHKGLPGAEGRRACASHVATLTACQAVMLALVVAVDGGAGGPVQALLGLAVNAATHQWIDRRRTLEGLALLMQRYGKHDYYTSGEQGRQALDQAAHMGWLLPAALIIGQPNLVAATALAGASLSVLVLLDMLSRLGWMEARRTARS